MAELIIAIGLPGSGKSTYISNKYDYDRIFNRGTTILSSDEIRKTQFGDVNDQTHNEEVFTYIKKTAIESLENGNRVIIDATNLSSKRRKTMIAEIESQIYGFRDFVYVQYLIIATPYYKCLENNRLRDRQVPDEIIKRMYKNFEFPTYSEGADRIEIVYPFKLDNRYKVKHPFENLMNFDQDNPNHELTLGEHLQKTYNIVKSLSNDKVLLKAAELHDIGKPFCKEYSEDRQFYRYIEHENVGSYEAMFYAKEAKFSLLETIDLCRLIRFHMSFIKGQDVKSIVTSDFYNKLRLLNIADEEAH